MNGPQCVSLTEVSRYLLNNMGNANNVGDNMSSVVVTTVITLIQ